MPLDAYLCQMVQAGIYHDLELLRFTEQGAYLDDGESGILLPKRFVADTNYLVGDKVHVFVYHDSEDRLIATTQQPIAILGEIARMRVVSTTPAGAFLDWGLMKDLFVPRSKQRVGMRVGGEYLVLVYLDEQTGRVAATEKFDHVLQNENLSVQEGDAVHLVTYRRTDIGYLMIINHQHTGVLHFSDLFREIREGDAMKGFVRKIRPDNTIDLILGTRGFKRVEDEGEKILRLLQENNGYLPYYDKSAPEEIYAFFGMSKKAFKMAIGTLYKQRKIELAKAGIQLIAS
jgi:predicted RNA-binding protein (virulence factor B family)